MTTSTSSASGHIAISHFNPTKRADRSDEYLELVNGGGAPYDLTGTRIHADTANRDFPLPDGTVLDGGQRLRIYTNNPNGERGSINLGSSTRVWNDPRDKAKLFNSTGGLLSEYQILGRATIAVRAVYLPGQPEDGEYVEIVNGGGMPYDISGFRLHAVATQQEYVFPQGTVIEGGDRLLIYTNTPSTGPGSINLGRLKPFWSMNGDVGQLFENKHTPPVNISEFTYTVETGIVVDAVNTTGDQYVTIRNFGKKPWDLSGYKLRSAVSKQVSSTFPDRTTLMPGASLKVYTNTPVSEPGSLNLNSKTGPVWTAEPVGDVVELIRVVGTLEYPHSGYRYGEWVDLTKKIE